MIITEYLKNENVEVTPIDGSLIVIGNKKIIRETKVDIILPQLVKSSTGIVIADSTTSVNHIYASVLAGKIK